MNFSQVLIKPLASEKSNFFKDKYGRFVFRVHPDANKIQIKEAVETVFGAEVLKVNVVRKRPVKIYRQGRAVGQKAGYKKAYVTVKDPKIMAALEGV